jgi:plasmid stabilization system protein ParE
MRLRFSPWVKHDLAEIAEYISQDSPRHAANWVRVLRSRFEEIAKQPLLYTSFFFGFARTLSGLSVSSTEAAICCQSSKKSNTSPLNPC